MAFSLAEAYVEISARSQLQQQLRQEQARIREFAQRAGGLLGGLRLGPLIGIGSAAAGLRMLGGVFARGVRDADEMAVAQAALDAALLRTGSNFAQANADIAKFTQAIQLLTGQYISDLTSQIAKLIASSGQFNETTFSVMLAAQGLGRVLNIDVAQAAKGLQKALGGNTSLLERQIPELAEFDRKWEKVAHTFEVARTGLAQFRQEIQSGAAASKMFATMFSEMMEASMSDAARAIRNVKSLLGDLMLGFRVVQRLELEAGVAEHGPLMGPLVGMFAAAERIRRESISTINRQINEMDRMSQELVERIRTAEEAQEKERELARQKAEQAKAAQEKAELEKKSREFLQKEVQQQFELLHRETREAQVRTRIAEIEARPARTQEERERKMFEIEQLRLRFTAQREIEDLVRQRDEMIKKAREAIEKLPWLEQLQLRTGEWGLQFRPILDIERQFAGAIEAIWRRLAAEIEALKAEGKIEETPTPERLLRAPSHIAQALAVSGMERTRLRQDDVAKEAREIVRILMLIYRQQQKGFVL